MKKLSLVLLAAMVALSMTACSNDEGYDGYDGQESSSSVVGGTNDNNSDAAGEEVRDEVKGMADSYKSLLTDYVALVGNLSGKSNALADVADELTPMLDEMTTADAAFVVDYFRMAELFDAVGIPDDFGELPEYDTDSVSDKTADFCARFETAANDFLACSGEVANTQTRVSEAQEQLNNFGGFNAAESAYVKNALGTLLDDAEAASDTGIAALNRIETSFAGLKTAFLS